MQIDTNVKSRKQVPMVRRMSMEQDSIESDYDTYQQLGKDPKVLNKKHSGDIEDMLNIQAFNFDS